MNELEMGPGKLASERKKSSSRLRWPSSLKFDNGMSDAFHKSSSEPVEHSFIHSFTHSLEQGIVYCRHHHHLQNQHNTRYVLNIFWVADRARVNKLREPASELRSLRQPERVF